MIELQDKNSIHGWLDRLSFMRRAVFLYAERKRSMEHEKEENNYSKTTR